MGYVSDSFQTTSPSSTTYSGLKYTTKAFKDLVPFGSSVEDVKAFLSKFAISKLYNKFPFDYSIFTRATSNLKGNVNPRWGGIWSEAYIVPMYDTSSSSYNPAYDMPNGAATHPRNFEYINVNKNITAYPSSGANANWHLLDLDINRVCLTLEHQYCFKDSYDQTGSVLQYTLDDDEDLDDLADKMSKARNVPTIQALSFYFLNDSNNWVKCNNITLAVICLNCQNYYNETFYPVKDMKIEYLGITMGSLLFNNSTSNTAYKGQKIIPMCVIPETSGDKGYIPYIFTQMQKGPLTGWHVPGLDPKGIDDSTSLSEYAKVEYKNIVQNPQILKVSTFTNSTYLSQYYSVLHEVDTFFGETHTVYYDFTKVAELIRYIPIPFVNTNNNMNAGKTLEDKIANGHWYYPIITDNGTTNAAKGDDINDIGYLKDNPDGDISFGGKHTNGYVTDDDSDIIYNSNTPGNIPALSTIGVFNTSYAISQNTLNRFAAYFWNDDDVTYDELIENLGMFNNPIDGIIGIRLFPLDLTSVGTGVASADTDIVLGRSVLEGIRGRKLFPNWQATVDMGSLRYAPRYGNFLDYEPYSSATLYLPYIGSIELACNFFLNKTVSVKYIIDITTGACSAMIYSDSTLIKTVDGVCGIEIPVSAANRQDYVFNKTNNEVKTTTNAIGSATTAIGQLASGDIGGAISTTIGAATSYATNKLAGKEIKADITKSSASTPTSSLWQPQNCFLVIERSHVDLPESYGHNVGYMLNQTRKLSTLKGFTTCANPHIDELVATDTEKSMIVSALVSGIIL